MKSDMQRIADQMCSIKFWDWVQRDAFWVSLSQGEDDIFGGWRDAEYFNGINATQREYLAPVEWEKRRGGTARAVWE